MSAIITAHKQAKRTPVPMNGVDTPALFATINAVGAQPELAKFQFRAKSRWLSGTHSESTMHSFFGAGSEHTHVAPYTAEGDHPAPPLSRTGHLRLDGDRRHSRRSGPRGRQS